MLGKPDTAGQTFTPAPTVVVVDDDPALLNALTFGMEIEGYRVLPYPNAEALLDRPFARDIACFVIDHRLPRIDGLFLIELIRARGATAPAILITSHPAANIRARCSSLGVPIIEKPLLRNELSDAIRLALGA